MTSTDLLDDLRARLPGITLDLAPSPEHPALVAPAGAIVDVCRALREGRGFILLADITAVDWWPREPRFEVVYHLASDRERLRVKTSVDGAHAHVPTLLPVWPAAGWLEREVWDMFGIVFDGHGDLRRLLMPEDWEGHPLRKDYPVQIRLRPRSTEPLQVSEAEFRANIVKDRNERRSDRPR